MAYERAALAYGVYLTGGLVLYPSGRGRLPSLATKFNFTDAQYCTFTTPSSGPQSITYYMLQGSSEVVRGGLCGITTNISTE